MSTPIATELSASHSPRLRTSILLPAAASVMIAFSSSSVSLSPKNRPFALSTTMLRTSRRFTATASLPGCSLDGLPLGEAGDGLLLGRVDIEHQRQLGDDEDVLDALVHGRQLHLAAAARVRRVRRDQRAERGGVQVLRLGQVDHEVLVALFDQLLDRALELFGLLSAREVALRREGVDRSHLPALHCGHPHPPGDCWFTAAFIRSSLPAFASGCG